LYGVLTLQPLVVLRVQLLTASLFTILLLVHYELSQYLDKYPPFPVKKDTVVMVITPTKGLANSIVCIFILMFSASDVIWCRYTNQNLLDSEAFCTAEKPFLTIKGEANMRMQVLGSNLH
jgi:hypothetical protein